MTNKAMDFIESRPDERAEPGTGGTGARGGSARQLDDVILKELLDRLDTDKRAILVLFYLEGLTVAELGLVLRVPPGTVRSRLHASRAEFKRLWEERGELCDDG